MIAWKFCLLSSSAQPDLADQLLTNADCEWLIDGSSKIVEGIQKTGYALVTQQTVVEAGPLPSSWSAQAVELYGLVCALTLGEGQCIN